MHFIFLIFLSLSAFAIDFDYAVIGTSPICLFEALYKYHLGERVVIFEAAAECGGAWKSIDICGVSKADMGCHEISSSPDLNRFLEEYAGCSMIACNTNYYFSKGCFELIDNLLKRVKAAGIPLINSCRVESIHLDQDKRKALLQTEQGIFTVSKIVVTAGSSLSIDGIQPQGRGAHQFYHLYLLLQDATPLRFSYHSGMTTGVSRMMNLTSFLGLDTYGLQLVVLQTHSNQQFQKADLIFEDLKKSNLIDAGARLMQTESYVYEQGPYFQMGALDPNQQSFFEFLNTSHFNMIGTYSSRWKQALSPYREGLP